SDAILSCSGGISKVLERCAEPQRCVEQSGAVACGCDAGATLVDGRCVEATSCDEERGGCDTLTECSIVNGTRKCSPCPDGFTGDGIAGCTPVLTSLGRVDEALAPVFSSTTYAYRLRLGLFQAHVVLQPIAADGVRVEVNGSEVAADGEWRSELLSFGETPLAITLTAQNGRSARYEVTAERSGAEEAFVKAMYPETNDTFGYSVAISGDTIAVGATSEDGAVAGVDGDQTSNGAAESGAVYVFVREGTTWHQEAYLKSDRPEELNYFGGAVVLDRDTLLVGEPRSTPYPTNNNNADARPGVVHVYTRSQGAWSHEARIDSPSGEPDLFGYSLAISEDAAVIGAPYDSANGRNAGAIYTLPRTAAW
ncbi:MAG TPA: cadherin-like beta sandwich domain-containing protein, partial [Polyangiales bacterium]|nr:cadherin-like beta sandwich domain-containing protein [Polyangiales bacterium]